MKLLLLGADRGHADLGRADLVPKSSITRSERAERERYPSASSYQPSRATRRRHDEAQQHTFAVADMLGCSKEVGLQRSGRLTVHMQHSDSSLVLAAKHFQGMLG